MDIYRRSPTAKFGIAVLSFVMALALRVLGKAVLGNDAPFLFFIAALALASWYGGLAPGILATLLGAVATAILFLPPITQAGTLDITHILHIGVYIATGVFISVLMRRLHAAVERSERTERELENRVQERTNELAQINCELKAEKNKLLGILDQMREAVCIINPQCGIEYTNPAMEREFGPVNGQKCYQYMDESESSVCARCRNSEVFEGKSFSQEWTSPKNNKVYDCFDAPITIEGVPCKLKIMHDITGLKKAEEELMSRHREIQRLSSELLTAQETERLRISRELHDDLGQSLTLIKLKVGMIKMNLPVSEPSLREYCDDASAQVSLAIENMRRLSRDLSPATVEVLGITSALRHLAEDFDHVGTMRVMAEVDNIDDLFPMQSNILLYRILQEGLNNIVKHSGADTVNFSLERSDGWIRFHLKDNGSGADLEKSFRDKTKPGGMGMAIMKERVRTLGGDLQIQSREERGMELQFSVPVAHEIK